MPQRQTKNDEIKTRKTATKTTKISNENEDKSTYILVVLTVDDLVYCRFSVSNRQNAKTELFHVL